MTDEQKRDHEVFANNLKTASDWFREGHFGSALAIVRGALPRMRELAKLERMVDRAMEKQAKAKREARRT